MTALTAAKLPQTNAIIRTQNACIGFRGHSRRQHRSSDLLYEGPAAGCLLNLFAHGILLLEHCL
jgi:hypothetical protein